MTDTSKVYEAADMLEKFAFMLKENPQDLIELANSAGVPRESMSGYLEFLAESLRREHERSMVDGR